MRILSGQDPIGTHVTDGAHLAIQWVRKKYDVTDAIVLERRWRNQVLVRLDGLHALGQIEVRADDDAVAIPFEGIMKSWVTVVRRIRDEIELHAARTRTEKTIKQDCPNCARPRIGPFGH